VVTKNVGLQHRGTREVLPARSAVRMGFDEMGDKEFRGFKNLPTWISYLGVLQIIS